MDEIDHLVSSLGDHLDAVDAKSLSGEIDSQVDEAQSIAADIRENDTDHEAVHERTATVLDLLEEIEREGTGNDEADRHVDAAKRAAERVLDR